MNVKTHQVNRGKLRLVSVRGISLNEPVPASRVSSKVALYALEVLSILAFGVLLGASVVGML